MEIIVDENDPRPIHQQVFEEIKVVIACRELREGEDLPQVRYAKTNRAVSLNALAIAYTQLLKAGLIEDRHGRLTVATRRIVIKGEND